jgi:formylglycine-generating enzyme required for sulfatase activity/tRNA A-37 threonylcarbamoyl transferase component Bud32
MNDDPLAEQVGAALGDAYDVVRRLGEGGFAVVYLVRDRALKRDLAVKVLSPDVITSKSMLERFRREAETIAGLSHPNIVPLYFIGQRDDLLYLAMPCIAGGSIADRLAREGPLPVDDVVRIVTEVASALAHAHKRGVIHRDIKPPNILVDAESGRCLVTDFGIARSTDLAQLTATGIMLGTPAYLSPEQVTGEAVDHRVDIYALGVMAYELLTGRVPFEGPTPMAAMMKRLGGPPDSVITVRADVPRHVADAITACLAADPAERPQTADDVARAFDARARTTSGTVPTNTMSAAAVPTGAPTGATATRPAPRRAWRIGIGLLTAVVVGTYLLASRRAETGAATSAATPAVSDSGMVVIPAGDYVIGSDDGPAFVRPRHTEHVDAFRIDRTEVTVGDYKRFVIATHAPAPWGRERPGDRMPVTRVTWGDASNYCAWEYRDGGRLPTEVEWEAAARGPSGRAFPHGDARQPASANTESAHRTGPAPVGSFPRGATPEGVEDMSGNVWEWTSSPMASYPDVAALPDSMVEHRVIRGGAFDTADTVATGWWRGHLRATTPGMELPNTGFRCVARRH